MLIIECKLVDKTSSSPISFKHVTLWCLSFDPHLTTPQSSNRYPIVKSNQITPAYLRGKFIERMIVFSNLYNCNMSKHFGFLWWVYIVVQDQRNSKINQSYWVKEKNWTQEVYTQVCWVQFPRCEKNEVALLCHHFPTRFCWSPPRKYSRLRIQPICKLDPYFEHEHLHIDN